MDTKEIDRASAKEYRRACEMALDVAFKAVLAAKEAYERARADLRAAYDIEISLRTKEEA